MGFLNTSWKALVGAVLAFLAIFAAASAANNRKAAQKERKKGEQEALKDVERGTEKAKVHFDKAAGLDQQARAHRDKARKLGDEIAKQDIDDLDAVVRRWGHSNSVRNRSR